MLSELLRFHLVDARQRRARLVDISLGSLDTDYPAVAQMLYHRSGRGLRVLDWDAVTGFERKRRGIHVPDLDSGEEVKPSARPNAVWVGRDVLDAIIIDLQARHIALATDLLLTGGRGGLRLRAAATGLAAMLRRISGGLYRGVDRHSLSDWKRLEFLRGDPQQVRRGAHYHRRITQLPAGQIAHLTQPLPYLHAAELLELLPHPLAADTLELLPIERQLQIFEELEDQRALTLLGLMAPDVAADLLGCLDLDTARRFLNRLPRSKAERVIDLLRYPADTVGGKMTNDVVTVAAGFTVGKARSALRERLKEPDFVHFLYVVDDEEQRHLQGVLSLRGFITAGDERVVGDLINRQLLTLRPLESPRKAAFRVLESELAALPVVDAEGRLLGVLTVDAAVSLAAPRSWSTQAPRVFS